MKSIWKGSISFGLVTIPIELYSAIQKHSFGFKLLHKKCNTPINYKRWCPNCNKEISWQDVVKGIKLSDGTYFIITKENLDKIKPAKSDLLSIVEFVNSNSIEPIYFDNHYYIAPIKNGDPAYSLFITALEKLNVSAIGQFIMKEKEHICAIKPYKNNLLLTTLNYAYEIKEVPEKKSRNLKVPKKELDLALKIIKTLAVANLDIAKFKDNFAQELRKKINSAIKNKPIIKKLKKEKIKPKNLLESLKATLKVNHLAPEISHRVR